jgi:VanZ family protein
MVVVGSLMPDNSLPIRALGRLHISDKIQHFAAYAFLAFLPAIHERPRIVWAIVLGLIGLGVLLEFGQSLASRDFELADMLADAVGVIVGAVAGWPLRR